MADGKVGEAGDGERVVRRDDGIDVGDLDSATLRRLLEEVRNGEPVEAHAYNRMHNRHNR